MFDWDSIEGYVAPSPGCVNTALIERILLARKVGRFLSNDQNEAERAVAEAIARVLAADVASAVREALAFELRLCKNLPCDIALRLARDVEDVASPFLQDSESFTPEQLEELVGAVEEYARVSIARRRNLPAGVSLELTRVGGERAVRTLVRNTTAELPEAGYNMVMERFPEDRAMMDDLSIRENIPLSAVARLVGLVSEKTRNALVKHYHVDREVSKRLAHGAEIRSLSKMLLGASPEQIQRYAEDLHRARQLTDALILDMLRAGSLDFFAFAMAARIGIPPHNVHLILSQHLEKGFARLLVRAGIDTALCEDFHAAVESAARRAELTPSRTDCPAY